MKKLAFLIVGIWSSGVMAKTIYYGTINGAVRDYYPKAHVTKVVLYNNTATSGIEGSIVERSQRNDKNLIEQVIKEGRILCKNEQGYFIDNLRLRHTPFGDLSNVLTEMSANLVCIGKEK